MPVAILSSILFVARLASTPSSTAGAPALNILRDFVYDEDGNLVREQWTQAGVGTISRTHAYDERGRRTSTTEGGINTPTSVTSFQYDSSDNLVKVTHPEQDADVLIYDARNLLVGRQRLGPDGLASALHTFTRDADGRVTDDFDGINTHTRVIYDGAGRPVKVTTPRGTDIAVTYDAAGQAIAVETQDNTGGSSTVLKRHETAYAGTGQVASESDKLIDPQNPGSSVFSTTRYAYDLAGRLARVTDPNGHFVDYPRDDHGRVTQQIDMFGNKSLFSYDQADNVLQRIDSDVLPDGTHEADRSFAYAFDALNRLLTQTDPLSHTSSFSYDELGHVLSKRDGVGSLWTYGYDDRGRLSTEIDPLGNAGNPNQHRTSYSYNRDGILHILTDAEGHATTYDRDSIQRLLKTTWPDSKFQAKSWNGDGTVATATDENGSVATFTYDPDDQVNAVTYQRATGVVGVTQESFTYDLLGRLTSASADSGIGNTTHTTQRSYDSLDRLLSDLQDGRAIAYSYDLTGNRTGETYPSNRIFKRSYDPLNRLSQLQELTDPNSANGRLVRSFDYAGQTRVNSASAPGGIREEMGYDPARRLTNLAMGHSAGGTIDPGNVVSKYLYAFTNDNLPKYEQRVHEGNAGDVYQFDVDKRLTLQTISQADPTGPPDSSAQNKEAFTLGNVHEATEIDRTVQGILTAINVSSTPRYGITGFGGETLSRDSSGNKISDPSGVYAYDANNRLVHAALNVGSQLDYGYDALGRRVEEKATLGTASNTDSVFFDGWNAVQRINGDNLLTKEWVYSGGLDAPIEYRHYSASNISSDYELFADARGSITTILDANGQLVDRVHYTSYGIPSFDNGNSIGEEHLWQGMRFDANLGAYDARHRLFDPRTANFWQFDPAGYADSPNGYAFAVDDPWGKDPMGLCLGVNEVPCSEYLNRASKAVGKLAGGVESSLSRTGGSVIEGLERAGEAIEQVYGGLARSGYTHLRAQALEARAASGTLADPDATHGQRALARQTLILDTLSIAGAVEGASELRFATGSVRAETAGAPAAVESNLAIPLADTAGENGNLEAFIYEGAADQRGTLASSPSQLARSRQGVGAYPGVDRWRDITLKKGKIVLGGEPGLSGFFTTERSAAQAGSDATALFQGMQVSPRGGMYRPGITAFEVMEDSPAAFGIARANPQFGSGGFQQLYIPGFENRLRPIRTDLLVNRVASPLSTAASGP